MKLKIYFFLFLSITSFRLSAQARLVLNDDPYVVMNNNVFIVLENNNINAITLTGTVGSTGGIVSEAENNRIRWRIGTNTGAYTIPFADNQAEGGTKIPFTFTITTAGASAAGFIDFSTYDGPDWDNNTYRPSMVTHMGQLLPPNVANHSAKAIDRFWLVNAQSYSTRPSGTLTFTYIDNEHTASGNTITEANLGAQRFNNTAGTWGDMLPQVASLNTTTNVLVTPAISAANMFAAWTLSQTNDPLPIKLLSFTAECKNGKAYLQWSTASETNNDFFTLEKTKDGLHFDFVAKIKGAGNSNTIKQYAYFDNLNNNQTVYYRLSQTDYDGTTEYFDLISLNCNTSSNTPLDIVSVYNAQAGNSLGVFSIPNAGSYLISIIDASGRLIYNNTHHFVEGINQVSFQLNKPSSGIYFIRLQSENEQISKKFFIN
jgi:hypothetical protein